MNIKSFFWYEKLLWSILAGAALYFSFHFLLIEWSEATLRVAVRTSIRLAALCFAGAFAASALFSLKKSSFTFWLRSNRKYLGISFALLFFFHIILLYVLQRTFHPVFDRAPALSLFGGGGAAILSFLMFLTSFRPFSDWLLPKYWKGLHLLGGWWVWVIFMRGYTLRVFDEQGSYGYLPMFLLFAAIGLLRMFIFLKKKK